MKSFFLFKFPIAIAYLFLLNSVSCCSKPKHIETEEEKERAIVLKHKIKSITEYRTSVFLGVKQQEQLSRVRYYNSNGLKTNETDYTPDGDIDCMLNYEYDKNNNLILISAISPDSSLLFSETKTYDEDNNRKELYFYHPDGTYKYRNIAIFDEEGRMIELNWYWPTGFKAKNKFEYKGRKKITDTEFNPQGILTYKWIYKYDDRENLIEAIQYSPSESINRKISYEFNNKNQLEKETNYSGESLQGSTTFLYDQKNLLLSKIILSPSGKITATFRYQYEFR